MATINAPPPSPIQGATKGIVSYMIEQGHEQVELDICCKRLEMATINAPPPSPIQGATKGIVSYMIEQGHEQVEFDIDGLISTPLEKSWRLCYLPTPQTERESHIWDQIQSAPGIYTAGISNNGKFNEIAVDLSYLPWLFRHWFELILNCDPMEPAEKDVLYYGAGEAKTRAHTHFLEIAAKACRSGPRELRLCFLETAQLHGLQIPLEWTILNQDILISGQVCEKFTKNLVILGLNLLPIYHTSPALELLGKCQGELLQLVADQSKTGLRRPFREGMQMISLVRLLLEFSGGREDFEQNKFDREFAATENAQIFCDLLGITGSNFFGRFKTQNMLDALSTSKIFTDNDLKTINVVERSCQMIYFLPIGYQQGHLNLPDQVLHGLGMRCVNEIGIFIDHFYHSQPSLRSQENNTLLLLAWSPTAGGNSLGVLSQWAASDDGLSLYQRSVRDIQDSCTIEQLALTLSALLCQKRLLPYIRTDITQSIGGSYLSDFDTLIKGERLSNERAIFERMGFSLLRVFETFSDGYRNILEFLTTVLQTAPPMLHRFDGFSDQYWVFRMGGSMHGEAFGRTGIRCLSESFAMEAEVDGEEGWTTIEK